jgi:hypothetical protein
VRVVASAPNSNHLQLLAVLSLLQGVLSEDIQVRLLQQTTAAK